MLHFSHTIGSSLFCGKTSFLDNYLDLILIIRWLLSSKDDNTTKQALHFIYVIANKSKISVFASTEFAKKLIDIVQPIAERTIMLDYRCDIQQPLKGNEEDAYFEGPKGTHYLASMILTVFKSTLGYD